MGRWEELTAGGVVDPLALAVVLERGAPPSDSPLWLPPWPCMLVLVLTASEGCRLCVPIPWLL